MSNYIHTFLDFVNEAAKWTSSGLDITLDQLKDLPSYKNLSKYGIDDISTPLQQGRLNFRFKIPTYAVKPKSRVNYRGDTKYSPTPTEKSLGHIIVFDVNQRSGKLQAYWASRVYQNPNTELQKQEYSGANCLKNFNRPLTTSGDFDIMFRHIGRWVDKKIKKDSPNVHSYRNDITPEELADLKIDDTLNRSMHELF